MKKEFNVLRILYICWSIAIAANVISFSISKETNTLISLTVLSVCMLSLLIFDLIGSSRKCYIVIIDHVYYRYSDNIVEKCKIIREKKLLNKKIKNKFGGKTIKSCYFENQYAKVYFDIIDREDNYSLLIVKKVKENKNNTFSFELLIEDKQKNLSYIKKTTPNNYSLMDSVEIKYDKNYNHAVTIQKNDNNYQIKIYKLDLANTFFKAKEIDTDILIWCEEYECEEKVYLSLEEAIYEMSKIIYWYDYGYSTPTDKMFLFYYQKKGSGYIEFQLIESNKPNFNKIEFSKKSSLFVDVISDESMDEFLVNYGDVFDNGLHPNNTKSLDLFGINYYSLTDLETIIKKIEDNRPKDYETILEWLHMVQRNYKGFYILGV
jgi:hypothetical protein